MRSDIMKEGSARPPALLKAASLSDGRSPATSEAQLLQRVVRPHAPGQGGPRGQDGVLDGRQHATEFNTIAVCDSIAMGHEGMRYSLCAGIDCRFHRCMALTALTPWCSYQAATRWCPAC